MGSNVAKYPVIHRSPTRPPHAVARVVRFLSRIAADLRRASSTTRAPAVAATRRLASHPQSGVSGWDLPRQIHESKEQVHVDEDGGVTSRVACRVETGT